MPNDSKNSKIEAKSGIFNDSDFIIDTDQEAYNAYVNNLAEKGVAKTIASDGAFDTTDGDRVIAIEANGQKFLMRWNDKKQMKYNIPEGTTILHDEDGNFYGFKIPEGKEISFDYNPNWATGATQVTTSEMAEMAAKKVPLAEIWKNNGKADEKMAETLGFTQDLVWGGTALVGATYVAPQVLSQVKQELLLGTSEKLFSTIGMPSLGKLLVKNPVVKGADGAIQAYHKLAEGDVVGAGGEIAEEWVDAKTSKLVIDPIWKAVKPHTQTVIKFAGPLIDNKLTRGVVNLAKGAGDKLLDVTGTREVYDQATDIAKRMAEKSQKASEELIKKYGVKEAEREAIKAANKAAKELAKQSGETFKPIKEAVTYIDEVTGKASIIGKNADGTFIKIAEKVAGESADKWVNVASTTVQKTLQEAVEEVAKETAEKATQEILEQTAKQAGKSFLGKAVVGLDAVMEVVATEKDAAKETTAEGKAKVRWSGYTAAAVHLAFGIGCIAAAPFTGGVSLGVLTAYALGNAGCSIATTAIGGESKSLTRAGTDWLFGVKKAGENSLPTGNQDEPIVNSGHSRSSEDRSANATIKVIENGIAIDPSVVKSGKTSLGKEEQREAMEYAKTCMVNGKFAISDAAMKDLNIDKHKFSEDPLAYYLKYKKLEERYRSHEDGGRGVAV